MVNAVSTAPTFSTSSGTSKSTGQATADEQQDRFLRLLVAQLNNQDPMNPMDNAQMTSQMAQINTVTGINQLNETMKSMGTQFAAMQLLQGAAMVGHDVLVSGNQLSISNGKAGGAVDLASGADKVTVEILSPGGQVVDTLNLGVMAAGRHTFEWDAAGYTGGGNPSFKVTATMGKSSIAHSMLARDTITSVSTEGGALALALKGRPPVSLGAIQSIL